jgi:hypothetical protein
MQISLVDRLSIQMSISEITRRNIFDALRLNQTNWHGRLTETEFLSRIFDLNQLSSTDGRFKNMASDIVQHRYNNLDWEDDWIYDDHRLNLLKCEDPQFLQFLYEMR